MGTSMRSVRHDSSAPSCEDGHLLLLILCDTHKPSAASKQSCDICWSCSRGNIRPLMEQDALTEEQWEFFGDPFTDMNDECNVEDAAQHDRAVAVVVTAAAASCDAQKAVGGSILGRRRNVDRDFDEGFTRINSDYFGFNPVYDAATFARRFRMPHSVFNRICTALSGRPEFLRISDALGVLGLYPL